VHPVPSHPFNRICRRPEIDRKPAQSLNVAVGRLALPRPKWCLWTDILDADGVQNEANRYPTQRLRPGEALLCVLGHLCGESRDGGTKVRIASAPIICRQALALAEPVKL
jgi:hypothetical protein